jgi:hypothetical protein
MDQLLLKERSMDLGANQEFLKRKKAQTTYCRRRCSNLLTGGRISGTWSSDFGAMRDARDALLRRGVFIQREVHTRNSGLARKLGARSRLNK